MNELIYNTFPRPVRYSFVVLTFALMTFIFFQSLTPVRINIDTHNTDKMVHFAAYFILASIALPAFPKTNALFVLLAVIGFGGLIEFLQGLNFVGRTPDIWDFFANGLGAICAWVGWQATSAIWRHIRP